jgi:hypothetical protein
VDGGGWQLAGIQQIALICAFWQARQGHLRGGLSFLGAMNSNPPFAAALNHLLEAESLGARAPRAVRRRDVELRAPPLPALRFSIATDGRLRAGNRARQAAALAISDGPGALAGGAGRRAVCCARWRSPATPRWRAK